MLLASLETKKDIDRAIKGCEDKVLVLRFGRETDAVCMQLDEIVCTSHRLHAYKYPTVAVYSSNMY